MFIIYGKHYKFPETPDRFSPSSCMPASPWMNGTERKQRIMFISSLMHYDLQSSSRWLGAWMDRWSSTFPKLCLKLIREETWYMLGERVHAPDHSAGIFNMEIHLHRKCNQWNKIQEKCAWLRLMVCPNWDDMFQDNLGDSWIMQTLHILFLPPHAHACMFYKKM